MEQKNENYNGHNQCIVCHKQPIISNIVFCKSCFDKLHLGEKGVWVSEKEARDLINHLDDWATKQQKDSEYYKKKIVILRKRFKQK